MLGDQFRIFDPNQSIYILEGSGSFWIGQNEIAGLFHHVSRHLSDRPKTYGIAFNSVGIRYLRKFDVSDRTSVAVTGTLAKVIAKADVDYTWKAGFAVTVRHARQTSRGCVRARVGRHVHRRSGAQGPQRAARRPIRGRRPVRRRAAARSSCLPASNTVSTRIRTTTCR